MYLKTAFRNIRKNRGFSLINILGFSLGITCFLLLAGYIYHEANYDRFLGNSERIALVSAAFKSGESDEFQESSVTPTAVAPLLIREFPEVEKAVRAYQYNDAALIRKGNDWVKESKLKFVDREFLEVFDYPIIAGDAHNALANPNTIVLTKDLALKYFQEADPIDKTLRIDDTDRIVTAVIDNPPTYSEIQFSALLSNVGLERYKDENWGSANDITFMLLKDPSQLGALEKKFNTRIEEMFKDAFANGYTIKMSMESLPSLHLHSKAAGSGQIVYIYVFACLALALLLISCINFMNLSLAQAAERAKEIGVKKVLGARKDTIFKQFLFEGSLMVFISLLIGFVLAYFLFPFFAKYLGSEMQLKVWKEPLFFVAIIIFFITLSILASGWPAWLIAQYRPIKVLKAKLSTRSSKFNIGNILITVQYTVSIFLVICTFFAYKQMQFLQNTNTGLNRDRIVVLDGDVWGQQERETLKTMLLGKNTIKSVSASYDSPVNIQGGYTITEAEGKAADFSLSITAIPIEKDFLSVFEIPVLAGETLTDADILKARDISDNRSVAFVINKLAAQNLGWTPEQAIGKRLVLNGRKGNIKTVVDNFNFASLRDEVKPVVLFPEYNYFGNIFVKIQDQADTKQALADMEAVWKSMKPNSTFESHFLDDDYAKLYQQEQQTTKIMQLFALITISIACIGLFALSAYATQKRVKEIGIRKVLGASIGKIVGILTRDFIGLICIAFLLAVALGFLAMNKWLGNFAYHTNMDWWVFLLAGLMTLLVSFLTIGSHAVKAAKANPVDSLRDE